MIGRVDTGIAAGLTAPPARDTENAARQFESLLIAQMLKSARGSEGWFGTGEDSTASSALELAEGQFASAMAAQGGLGLARLIADGLERE